MGKKDIPAFLESIPDEKLCDWSDGNHTVFKDRYLGFRLDHQGVSEIAYGRHQDRACELTS